MIIPLVNYAGQVTETIEVDLAKVKEIRVDIYYGDETITVKYIDGEEEAKIADYAEYGWGDGYDGSYTLYNPELDIDTISEEWLACRNSYDRQNIGEFISRMALSYDISAKIASKVVALYSKMNQKSIEPDLTEENDTDNFITMSFNNGWTSCHNIDK